MSFWCSFITGCCLSLYPIACAVSEYNIMNVVCTFIPMVLKACQYPKTKARLHWDPPKVLTQPANPNSVDLQVQQKIKLVVQCCRVHGYTWCELTWLIYIRTATQWSAVFAQKWSAVMLQQLSLSKKDGLVPVKLMSSFWSTYHYFVARFAR